MKIYLCDFFDKNGNILVLDKKGYKEFMREKFPSKKKKSKEHINSASVRVLMLQKS